MFILRLNLRTTTDFNGSFLSEEELVIPTFDNRFRNVLSRSSKFRDLIEYSESGDYVKKQNNLLEK